LKSVIGKTLVCFSIMMLAAVSEGSTPVTANVSSGPEKGWLVLHGGGTKREYGAMHRFVELSGGAKANIVVVLTPIELEILTPEFQAQYKSWWASELGARNVTFLDTRNRQEADTDEFVAPLRKATGVWIMGGRMSYLLKYYLGNKTEQEIKAVVERGGVLAGSSAGAMIQSSFLVSRTNADSGGVKLAKGIFLDTTQLVGFGLLKDVAVDPHFFARHEENQMVRLRDLLQAKPEGHHSPACG